MLFGLELAAAATVASAFAPETSAAVARRLRAALFEDDTPTDALDARAASGQATDESAQPVVQPVVQPATPVAPVRITRLRIPKLRIPAGFAHRAACGGDDDLILLSPEVLEQLSNAVPRRYGDLGSWHLLFSTRLDGTSIAHMLSSVEKAGPCVLLLRDAEGQLFGAYSTELRNAGASFYGAGESFLFAISSIVLPPPPSLQATPPPAARRTSSRKLAPRPALATWVFPWSRLNEYFVRSDADSLTFGAGGSAGLMLKEDVRSGVSGRSETYLNLPLPLVARLGEAAFEDDLTGSPAELESAFCCDVLEVWGVDEVACRTLCVEYDECS